jgi:hypothetical protein
MLTFTPAELQTIITTLTWLGDEMKTFAGGNGISAAGLTTGTTVFPGSDDFPEAKALKEAIENMATTFGTEYTWLTGVVDKLTADTRMVVTTMEDGTSLATDEVSKFMTDFRGTLNVMGVSTGTSPTLEDLQKILNPPTKP